jgi:hypothetical protein
MSSKKSHIVIDRGNWKENRFALCGEPLVEPVKLYVWDEVPTGTKIDLSSVNKITTCETCLLKAHEPSHERETLYVVKERQFIRSREGEE